MATQSCFQPEPEYYESAGGEPPRNECSAEPGSRHYTGYEFQGVGRLKHGIFATFGYTLERQLSRNCADGVSVSTPLQNPNNLRYCDWTGDSSLTYDGINISSLGAVPSVPWANNFVGNAVVPIKWGIKASLSFVSNNYQGSYTSGSPLAAQDVDDGFLPRTLAISSAKTTVYPNGSVGAMAAGNPCTANNGYVVGCPIDPGYNSLQGATTVNLISPGAYRTPRVNQLDISITRVFRFREKYTLQPTFQLFNLLNSNAAVTQSTALPVTYSATNSGVAPSCRRSNAPDQQSVRLRNAASAAVFPTSPIPG